MIKKLYFFTLLCLILAGRSAWAQGELLFEKEVHDFGTIAEGTQASYEFRVKNVGTQPVIISAVQPSCGCTTPTWTKEPILPGKTGTIKAVYNSTGRPGAFSKAINVSSDAATGSHILYIKGEVGPKDLKLNYTAEQKAMSPRLAIGSTSYDFGKLEKGQKVVAKFRIRNNGRQPLLIQGVESACNCVIYRTSAPELKAGEVATLELRYDAAVLGKQKETVTVLSNDIVMPGLKLTLKAEVMAPKASKDIGGQGATPTPDR